MKVTGKRWLYAANGVVLLLFLGLIYAWSIFANPIREDLGLTPGQTSMVFTICMSMFCIGGFVSGLISKKQPPRLVVMLCAVFVLSGFLLAARVTTLSGLFLTYGGLVGFGVGLAYNALIGTITKWFPERTGFISGLLLMGFGFGGMVLGTISSSLIQSYGWRMTFTGIGIVFAVLILLGSLLVKLPPAGMEFPESKAVRQSQEAPGQDFTTTEMLKRPSFWMFFIWAVVLSAAGLALINQAAPCASAMGVSVGTAAVFTGLVSVFNGGGRVIMGATFDKIGRKKTMLIVSCGFILSGILLLVALQTRFVPLLAAAYVCTGFSYGGIMPCNSTFISKFYGRKNYALNFSMVNMNIILASLLGSSLSGSLLTSSGSYLVAFAIIPVYGVIAFVMNLLIKRP